MFDAVQITRRTAETEFAVLLRPRRQRMASLDLPNRILSHFIDHFCKAAGINVEAAQTRWPGSWCFDHVLCEDLGQLIGRGIAEVHRQLAQATGVAGRAHTACAMDDASSQAIISFEGRPSATWTIPPGIDIDRFVDAWYDGEGRMSGWAAGANLRQFIDGFAYGSGATIAMTVQCAGNLHHVYEAIFRALGDAVGQALGTGAAGRLPEDTSGLAGACTYEVNTELRQPDPSRERKRPARSEPRP